MGTVLIVDRDSEFVEGLAEVLRRDYDVTDAADLKAMKTSLETCRPHVVVFGPSLSNEEALAAGHELDGASPATESVFVASSVTTDLLRQAMRAGLHDVVSVAETFGDVGAAVIDAHDAADVEREKTVATDDSGTAAEPAAPSARGGKVITVFSTKGGVGKSVISTNLGIALAAEGGMRTVLLDLDLEFGDTGIMLQLRPTRTIFDAMLAYDRLDADMLSGFLTEHPSGLKVLLAPIHPEDAEAVTPSRVARIIGLLKEIADVVVIDTPGAFSDTVLAALDKSDEVYAVATMDVASIKNTRISLQKLTQLGYDHERIRLVLNRADSKVWIEPGEVESAVEGEIVAKIPSDRLVPRSVNKGVPVVLDAPKSAVAKALIELANSATLRNGEGG